MFGSNIPGFHWMNPDCFESSLTLNVVPNSCLIECHEMKRAGSIWMNYSSSTIISAEVFANLM